MPRQKRIPQRTDGIESKERLKVAAVKLFSKNNFADVSISQISKKAGLSSAAFYQYYLSKDEIFREIADEFFSGLRHSLIGKNLFEVGLSYIRYCNNNRNLVKAMHLNEYHFEWIRNNLEEILYSVSKKFQLSEVGHFYFWSPLRFAVNFGDLLDVEIQPEIFVNIVLKGINYKAFKGNVRKLPDDIFNFQPVKHLLSGDEKREIILANAESLFGTFGFNKTQIYDIARASGIAVGTFYLYFKTKKELLKELVEWISRGLRYNVKLAVERYKNEPRIIQELSGFYAFVQFFKNHTNMYKVVRESQSLDLELAKTYYISIYKPYYSNLRSLFENASKDDVIHYDKDVLSKYYSLMLMGLGHYLGEKYLISGRVAETENLEKFLQDLCVYICEGLGGE
ncbi:MAG: TetR/AcrR family transcriptional regulator [Fervidobacterium sp.]|uniref:TetR/AcrR family transcriptional regulator n=1 Tax=Fervidobacterium sp. TaxID=1871331 RepID=UPI00404B3CDD